METQKPSWEQLFEELKAFQFKICLHKGKQLCSQRLERKVVLKVILMAQNDLKDALAGGC